MIYKSLATLLLLFVLTNRLAAQVTPQNVVPKKMTYQDVYPVFISKNLNQTTDFYSKWFDLKVAFESGFFVLLVSEGEKPFSVGFLSEKHPSSPPTSPAMNSSAGVFLTLQVEDVASHYVRLKKAGLKISYALKDEPWGQRRFGVIDPNGMYVDVVEQIEPQKGFWERYPAGAK